MARDGSGDETAAAFTLARSRTRELVSAALIAALIAGTSWIELKLGPVPFTLQTAFVLLAALLLSPGWAAASMTAYLVLGAVGLPVFAGGIAGVGAFATPTGGFLVAFPLAAAAGSFVFRTLHRRPTRFGEAAASVVAVLVAEVVVYVVGVPWLAAATGMPVGAAVAVAMLPFLAPDALKAFVAVVVAVAIRRSTVG